MCHQGGYSACRGWAIRKIMEQQGIEMKKYVLAKKCGTILMDLPNTPLGLMLFWNLFEVSPGKIYKYV